MLARYGYKVTKAGTATEAKILYKFYSKKIDAVLIDLTLVGTNICSLINFLIQINPKIKMIATFGLGEEDILKELSTYYFTGSIQKPYFLIPLVRAVKQALEA